MKAPGRSLLLLLALGVGLGVMTPSCGDTGSSDNAPVLWLALDGRETQVRLIEQEPEPF
ncbi:MAG: hypothetical protein H0X17_01500 [Deltaproteobacteria bacterium]|nr:hypothetical protein [Deltaproteobacteria bacterium]